MFNDILGKIRKISQINGKDTPMFNTETDEVGDSDTIVCKKRHKGPTSSQ